MPKLNEINKSKKNFKKREYRPWDLNGNKNQEEQIASTDTSISGIVGNDDQLNSNFTEQIIEISTDVIKNWEYHDRPENELGDIESLANEFLEIGQQQPCIVRKINNDSGFSYELIVGERRWRAAQYAKIPLKVIIKSLSDSEAALIQAAENNNRKDLSDFARGMSYSRLIENGIISQKELSEKLKISKQQMSRLLSFSKIPTDIINAIGDFSKISARTAEQIKQLSTRGNDYVSAIILFADRLRDGLIGQEKLLELVEKEINKIDKKINSSNSKVFSRNGRHLFTWRQDNNACPSIHFPKDIAILIENNKIDLKDITLNISRVLEDSLMKIDINNS